MHHPLAADNVVRGPSHHRRSTPGIKRPSRAEAREEAVRTLLRWAGDDPDREGLLGTPDRVVRAYEEFFAGYGGIRSSCWQRTFEETDGYDEMVVLKDIRFESTASTTWCRSSAGLTSAYLPRLASSASASWRAWSRSIEAAADPGEDDGADRQHDR